mmetsp:Transcript_21803/g.46051  ORF Transcript_21803/g.46051 Transcript_21803/m.46051 type:complete len:647 (-) Transcript_21803:43-1983(-)
MLAALVTKIPCNRCLESKQEHVEVDKDEDMDESVLASLKEQGHVEEDKDLDKLSALDLLGELEDMDMSAFASLKKQDHVEGDSNPKSSKPKRFLKPKQQPKRQDSADLLLRRNSANSATGSLGFQKKDAYDSSMPEGSQRRRSSAGLSSRFEGCQRRRSSADQFLYENSAAAARCFIAFHHAEVLPRPGGGQRRRASADHVLLYRNSTRPLGDQRRRTITTTNSAELALLRKNSANSANGFLGLQQEDAEVLLSRSGGGQRRGSSGGSALLRTNSARSFLALWSEDEKRRGSANLLLRSNSADSFFPADGQSKRETAIDSAISRQDDDFQENSLGGDLHDPSDSKINESLWRQFVYAFATEWQQFSPLAINPLRVVEVTFLAALAGILFYTTGKDSSSLGLMQKTSLLFFGATLWTFERMYPSLISYSDWIRYASEEISNGRIKAIPLWLGRLSAINLAEFFWPFIYVTVCHTMAGIAGDPVRLIKNGFLLALNNACYVSLGSMLGSLAPSVPYALICSTITAQTSLIAAGFYTHLPPVIEYFRYVSPLFWCYKGILKSSYRWNDTYDCFFGSSDVGANQCFLEYNLGIDQTKKRGIEVATFNDEQSDKIYIECLALVAIFWVLQLMVLFRLWNSCSYCPKPDSRK